MNLTGYGQSMIGRKIISLLIALVFCASATAEVFDVRIVGDGAPTRITVWTDTPQKSRIYLTQDDEVRALALPMQGASTAASGDGNGGVESWSMTGDQLDFLLDRPMMVARSLSLPPSGSEPHHRVIIDLETVSEARFKSVAKRDMRKLAKLNRKTEKAARTFVDTPTRVNGNYVIVVDAGHGGKDPGAVAKDGTREKDLTLAAAKTLEALLEKDKRYEVRLTRDTDTYLKLEERVTQARDWGADLFISIHADAAASNSVAGASVYTISERGESRIDKEADKNDWKIPEEDGTTEEVNGILRSLVKRETKTHSSMFAEMLLPELQEAGPVLRSTHRNAGFYVLLAPDVPAVLLEMGFLTNQSDVRRLKSASGRHKSMVAVKNGIDAFFQEKEMLLAGG